MKSLTELTSREVRDVSGGDGEPSPWVYGFAGIGLLAFFVVGGVIYCLCRRKIDG